MKAIDLSIKLTGSERQFLIATSCPDVLLNIPMMDECLFHNSSTACNDCWIMEVPDNTTLIDE